MGGEITVGVIGVSVDGPVAGDAMISTTMVGDAMICSMWSAWFWLAKQMLE